MEPVSFTEFRQNLARHLDAVAVSGQNLVVTRQGKATVVVMTLEEFEGWQETVHLLSSPANAVRLLRSVKDADEGRFVEGVALDDFGSWDETAHLLSTPTNAKALLESIAQVKGGKLIGPDGPNSDGFVPEENIGSRRRP